MDFGPPGRREQGLTIQMRTCSSLGGENGMTIEITGRLEETEMMWVSRAATPHGALVRLGAERRSSHLQDKHELKRK
jgi:hypothetical protein